MRWRLVALISTLGVAYGLLTVFPVIVGYEYWFVFGGLFLAGKTAGLFAAEKPVLNGFGAGAGVAFAALWTQAILMPIYLANNPQYAGFDLPLGLSERMFTFALSPIGAIAGGLLAMIVALPFAWMKNRIFPKRG